jgi:hypothetical protein
MTGWLIGGWTSSIATTHQTVSTTYFALLAIKRKSGESGQANAHWTLKVLISMQSKNPSYQTIGGDTAQTIKDYCDLLDGRTSSKFIGHRGEFVNTDKPRLQDGISEPKRGFRWERIDLGSHPNVAPTLVGNPTKAHAGVLASAAMHSGWFHDVCTGNLPNVFVPGYKTCRENNSNLETVPGFQFSDGWTGARNQIFYLKSFSAEVRQKGWCVPTLLEHS